MENKTFDKAMLTINEPEKIKTCRYGNTVFRIGSFFAKESKETMKDILERSIRRDAKSKIRQ